MESKRFYYTNSDNKSLINVCRVAVGGASLPRLFPLNPQNAQNPIARWVSDRNATFLFRNGTTKEGQTEALIVVGVVSVVMLIIPDQIRNKRLKKNQGTLEPVNMLLWHVHK